MDNASLDQAIATLQTQKDIWAKLPVVEKFHHLMEMRRRTGEVAASWVELAAQAKGLPADSPLVGEEWSTGPWALLHGLNRYAATLHALAHGEELLDKVGPVRTRRDGQVIVQVAPLDRYESLILNGATAEIWMEPEVTLEGLAETVASYYRQESHTGQVALVLGAGNIAGTTPMDALHKLFTEGQVCLIKLNPVNDYLLPVLEKVFEGLIAYGFVRLVTGGADVGEYLVRHPGVDTVHITGSAQTHDAIVFGSGEEGARRKAEGRPRLEKPVTSELGNVSPTIVVPGPWTEADVRFQAENIVTQKLHNNGFNCIASQVLVLPAGWKWTPYLMGEIRRLLRTLPPRPAYYPGAAQRIQRFSAAHPGAEVIAADGGAPRVLLANLDPEDAGHIAFTEEAFAPVLAQVSLPATDAAGFLSQAVDFCNRILSGTLGANLIVHPKTERELGEALENAVAGLRYGVIGVNVWTGLAFLLSQTAWGAYPGHTLDDVQSGIGKVHNAFMFSKPQKTVARGPFYPFPRTLAHGDWHLLPKPIWFVTNRKAAEAAQQLTYFELEPGYSHIPRIWTTALRG